MQSISSSFIRGSALLSPGRYRLSSIDAVTSTRPDADDDADADRCADGCADVDVDACVDTGMCTCIGDDGDDGDDGWAVVPMVVEAMEDDDRGRVRTGLLPEDRAGLLPEARPCVR